MGMSVDTLVTELREHLGDDNTDLSDTVALLLLNRSFWEIMDKFGFREKEVNSTLPTVVDQRDYTIPSLTEGIQLISIKDNDDLSHKPLRRITNFVYESNYVEDDTSEASKPEAYFRFEDKFRLYPTPDDIYTLTIYRLKELADLGAGGDPPLPQSWDEIILYGAVWRGFARKRNLNTSDRWQNKQHALINSAQPVEGKEEIDSHSSGVNIPTELTARNW